MTTAMRRTMRRAADWLHDALAVSHFHGFRLVYFFIIDLARRWRYKPSPIRVMRFRNDICGISWTAEKGYGLYMMARKIVVYVLFGEIPSSKDTGKRWMAFL